MGVVIVKKLLLSLIFAVAIGMIGICTNANADTFNILVDSGSNSLVGETAVMLDGSNITCTESRIWEDTLSFDITVYLGDTDQTSYTIPNGTIGTIDYLIPSQKSTGIYVSTSVTAGAKVNFIGLKKAGYK
jgi:hypothetical protein